MESPVWDSSARPMRPIPTRGSAGLWVSAWPRNSTHRTCRSAGFFFVLARVLSVSGGRKRSPRQRGKLVREPRLGFSEAKVEGWQGALSRGSTLLDQISTQHSGSTVDVACRSVVATARRPGRVSFNEAVRGRADPGSARTRPRCAAWAARLRVTPVLLAPFYGVSVPARAASPGVARRRDVPAARIGRVARSLHALIKSPFGWPVKGALNTRVLLDDTFAPV